GVGIGGSCPVTVQSMLNVESEDIAGNVAQAKRLEAAGCDIIRIAVPDRGALRLIPALKEAVRAPIVADIHFDYRLALESVAAGADKIRINPGNIGDDDRVRLVAQACGRSAVPIRIGVNSGSLERHILAKYGRPTPEALCESALFHAALLNRFDFDDIIISIKSSDVFAMVDACTLLARQCDYPLHLGVTEAGGERMGSIKSAVGIGALLAQGIGDTIRVSLTAQPEKEIAAAHDILRAAGLLRDGVEIISCPTCGRTRIDVISLAAEAERRLAGVRKPLKVAIMGCAVNGPGEAREADIGIAGGDGEGLLFKKGVILRKVPEQQLIDELVIEIENL
ncbi:MAG: flavodoxin-dependent (E)-4-hydroxy-3-methylbut-2-enyl-diphosphate synthase, partial [Clostridia bacterium]|nr:flavodoxin-dependent (E)-4-hydroxy-3-methylbut-2-enyl-diphosphate synthase [Clostridia bacterium]